jgi:hypothetical protein
MTSMNYSSAAGELSSKGRNGDSMLVHMTPGEVGGLQSLAMAMGGSLTLNPDTGLPEANFLKKILPTILGAGLMLIPGVNALAAAGIVGAGQTALTGDISKGLMAGLGAFGGASMAGAAGVGGALSGAGGASTAAATNAATGTAAATPGISGAAANLASTGAPALPAGLGSFGTSLAPAGGLGIQGLGATGATGGLGLGTGAAAAKTGLAGFGQKFGAEAAKGLGGKAAKYAPYVAGAGLLNAANEASMPTVKMPEDEDNWDYRGPYLPQPRTARFQTPEQMRRSGGAEFSYFDDANPFPGYMPAPGMAEGGLAALPVAGDMQASMDFFNRSPGAITASMYPTRTPAPAQAPQVAGAKPPGEQQFKFAAPTGPVPSIPGGQDYFFGGMPSDMAERLRRAFGSSRDSQSNMYAKGGAVDMEDGSFVVDARTVSEMGNGSSNAGIERLAAMGGRPVRGGGDGVSDSVPARIGGRQEARVARDEVIFSPEAVARIGKGDHKRGTQKLYALMDKAHKARKKAGRGQDTKVAKGLGGLA